VLDSPIGPDAPLAGKQGEPTLLVTDGFDHELFFQVGSDSFEKLLGVALLAVNDRTILRVNGLAHIERGVAVDTQDRIAVGVLVQVDGEFFVCPQKLYSAAIASIRSTAFGSTLLHVELVVARSVAIGVHGDDCWCPSPLSGVKNRVSRYSGAEKR